MLCSSPRRRRRGPLAAIAVSLLSTAAAHAQVAGVVRDPASRPIPQATVALWRGEQEVARLLTDSAGRFRFAGSRVATATAILVRRIGFRPVSVPLPGQPTDTLALTLAPVAAPLPTVVVTAARRACPNREEPAARRLWRAMSAHYATHGMDAAVHAVMRWRLEEVDARSVGEVDETKLPPGEYAVVADVRRGYFDSIRRDGYARRLAPGEGTAILPLGAFFAWRYAPLHRELSEHFVEDDFAARHTLGLWHEADGSFTITFCGRDHAHPYLEGTLAITADTALAGAQWRFRTPPPDEAAGGRVEFVAPPRQANVWLLVPARSVFWRKIGGHRTLFFQEASVYTEWRLAPGAWP